MNESANTDRHEVAADDVLPRVRHAVARTPATERTPLPQLAPDVIRQPTQETHLVALYRQRAQAVGLNTSVTTEAQLAAHLLTVLHDLAVHTAALEPALPWHDLLAAQLPPAVKLLSPTDGDPTMYSVDAGITGVSIAVAETGSFLCPSGPSLWRGLSLIPPVHIALVRPDQIVPDLLDLFSSTAHFSINAPHLPAHASLITGPSKTADIEGILITGVHGPGRVHVCIVTPN